MMRCCVWVYACAVLRVRACVCGVCYVCVRERACACVVDLLFEILVDFFFLLLIHRDAGLKQFSDGVTREAVSLEL